VNLEQIGRTLLDESSSPPALRQALDEFVRLGAEVTGIEPKPGFDAWAGDTYLESGVAINPGAAAHCVRDYRRTVVFLRAVYAAIRQAQQRFDNVRIRILYAGCGPFATLVLPLLPLLEPDGIELQLVDAHQRSLRSVGLLLAHFGLDEHSVESVQADACSYRHHSPLHLVIAETMQKALEQEPQLAVMANLAPQLCPGGIFVPGEIEVELCLAHPERELETFRRRGSIEAGDLVSAGERHVLGTLLRLTAARAAELLASAEPGRDAPRVLPGLARVVVPGLENLAGYDPVLFTRIRVFSRYSLGDYESEITLPMKCHDLTPPQAGDTIEAGYELGSYPRFYFRSSTG
jgi:hypothetical protein